MATATNTQGGRKGKQQASVSPVFSNRLADLAKQAKQMHNAQQGRHQRQWQIPSGFQGSLLNICDLHKPAFERKDLNTQYGEATKDATVGKAGTGGDVISLKLQIDYNACEERAFRVRHTSLVRAMCIAHGRRIGQGHGTVWDASDGIQDEVAQFIAAGGVTT